MGTGILQCWESNRLAVEEVWRSPHSKITIGASLAHSLKKERWALHSYVLYTWSNTLLFIFILFVFRLIFPPTSWNILVVSKLHMQSMFYFLIGCANQNRIYLNRYFEWKKTMLTRLHRIPFKGKTLFLFEIKAIHSSNVLQSITVTLENYLLSKSTHQIQHLQGHNMKYRNSSRKFI